MKLPDHLPCFYVQAAVEADGIQECRSNMLAAAADRHHNLAQGAQCNGISEDPVSGRIVDTLHSCIIIPPEQRSCCGVYWFHSVRASVRPSVRLSRLPCPLCNIYSSGWILSILAINDHCHERVCRTQWPLTLTYIFKVIRSWLRKLCPLCSVYSSGWIIFIFGTNDHYY